MEKLKFYLNWILRCVLSITFVYAAISKIFYPNEFFNNIRNYQLISDYLSYVTAYFLPAFEIVIAIFILTKRFFTISTLSITFMLLIFILAILSAWVRGLDINCGCFGSGPAEGYEVIILRDLVLLFFCVILILVNKKILNYQPKMHVYHFLW